MLTYADVCVLLLYTAHPSLPTYWEEMRDSQGKTYYVNHQTKVTQWNRP
jgi:hypothetical protein